MREGRILLDTHALVWWALDERALSRKVKALIEDETTKVFVSAATASEIATKIRLGKLEWAGSESVESYCSGQGFELMPVLFAHAERAGSWPQAHGDPFDRMLAAQSAIENIRLATNDPRMAAFGIDTLW